MGFLIFIICTILGFYLLGFIGRIALSYFIKKKQREFQQQFGAKGNYTGQNQSNWNRPHNGTDKEEVKEKAKKQEGKIQVQQSTSTEKKVSQNVGEYVDFEEVK